MFDKSNCVRKSQFAGIRTELVNSRDSNTEQPKLKYAQELSLSLSQIKFSIFSQPNGVYLRYFKLIYLIKHYS